MHIPHPTSPAAAATSDDAAPLLSTHSIQHTASEPTGALASPSDPDASKSSLPPPPSASSRDAFAKLHPSGSHGDADTAAYTAAAAARARSLDQHGSFEAEFDPHASASPAALLKSLPEAASRTIDKTVDLTVAVPARTFDSIKAKLGSPTTTDKSKSEIPHNLSQAERDMSSNGQSSRSASAVQAKKSKPKKSGSFTSFLRGRSNASPQASALMQRGPDKEELPSSKSLTARKSLRRKGSEPGADVEEEEDEQVVRQRIRDQQKRLEDLDEAQTLGLLHTQQEAGIEPSASQPSPAKPSWRGVFGNLTGSPGATDDESDHAEGSTSRRSNSRRRGPDLSPDRDQHKGTAHVDDSKGLRRAKSEKHAKAGRSASRGRHPARSASASRAERTDRSQSRPRTDAHLSPPRRQSTTWAAKLRTKIPVKEFPLQGAGRESEFNQECPLWARQPWKYLYFSYFGLSVGLFYLPRWAVASLFPSHRGRPDWSWKKATMVKLYRHGTQLTFRTRTSLGRDLQKEVPHTKTVRCKFTWVEPVGEADVRGELRRAMQMQKVRPQRTCGFWYGDVPEHARKHRHGSTSRTTPNASEQVTPSTEAEERGAPRESEQCCGVGRPAEPGEKVLYHLHGGAYWIGTAHEKDVTAAVNTESLRYMAEIYKQRESNSASTSTPGSERSATSATYNGKLLRSFSLDYRLCVPGRPRAGSYPAALLDALSGYLYLTRDLGFAPENVVIAGDSAGGNLALALCRYLRDERGSVAPQPGALLLMSPWVDMSRSHAGPTGAPNLDSTVYTNQKSDIISSMIAFRNTAVSAFLGDLPARETYRNPYVSPVSLQLPLERGGQEPHYGFHGFPNKIYITSGSAEISYDQHLTLAHRLAAGTKRGRPVYAGDRLSAGCNAREMAERRERPRPKEMLNSGRDGIEVTPLEELRGAPLELQAARDETDDVAGPPQEPEAREERQVIFDEVKDAVHDYLLFKWFEPERSNTWRRIAQWIDTC